MARWPVQANGDDGPPLAEIISNPDGSISIHMPSPDPVTMTTLKAEEIRSALGAAIADAKNAGRRS